MDGQGVLCGGRYVSGEGRRLRWRGGDQGEDPEGGRGGGGGII